MTDAYVYSEGQVNSLTTSLLNGVRQGHEAAWHRLVDVYLPLIYQWCRRQNLQDADVLDVGQEVLQRVAANLKTFRREHPEDTFRGWLRQITRNAICDHFRRQQKQAVGPGGSTAQEQLANVSAPDFEDTEAARAEEIRIVYQRLVAFVRGEFSERDWQAFSQVVVENRTAAEVAEALGISRNQVYLAKSRILKRLREEFGTFQEEVVPS